MVCQKAAPIWLPFAIVNDVRFSFHDGANIHIGRFGDGPGRRIRVSIHRDYSCVDLLVVYTDAGHACGFLFRGARTISRIVATGLGQIAAVGMGERVVLAGDVVGVGGGVGGG